MTTHRDDRWTSHGTLRGWADEDGATTPLLVDRYGPKPGTMSLPVTALHVGFLGASALTNGALAVYAWRRPEPGARTFAWLVLGFGVYSVTHMAGLLTFHPRWRLVWENLQWIATAVVPVLWLVFTATYTGYDELLDRRTVGAVSVVPLVTIILTWTNPWHHLVWERNVVTAAYGLAILDQEFGPWFWIFLVFSYGAVGIGTVLVLRLIWVSDHLFVDESVLLAIGVLVPIVANGLTLLSVTPIRNPALDLTPYAFLVTGLAFWYALFRGRLLDLVPATRRLGRDAAVAHLEDGVVVVDTDRQVVYCNDAAGSVLGCSPAETLGRDLQTIVDDRTLEFGADDALAELVRDGRTYELRSSPIRDRTDDLIGHTLVIYDVTARKRRIDRLARQREELETLNELNAVIRGVNLALVSARTRAEIEQAVCDRLVDSEFYDRAFAADVTTWRGDTDRWTSAGGDGESEPGDLLPWDADTDDVVTVGDGEVTGDRWTVVPLTHGRTVYGALALSTHRGTVGDRELAVLGELGKLIGHAIQAVQNRQLLSTDAVVELELASTDERSVLARLAAELDGPVEVEGLVPTADEVHLAYIDVPAAPVDLAVDVFERLGQQIRVVQDGAGTMIEWTVSDDVLLGELVRTGGNVDDARADVTGATYRLTLPTSADVRRVVDRITSTYPETHLVSKHERDRVRDTPQELPGKTIEDLTERQSQVLEAAYRSGYFEWPRGSTAEDVAEGFDITAPTFHAHLRKAEKGIMDQLFSSDRK